MQTHSRSRQPHGSRLGIVASAGLALLACSGQTTNNNRCNGVTCPSDAACDPTTGACAALPACDEPADCLSDQCVSGVCSSCDTNITCTEGLLCSASTGRCVPCRGNSDCGGAFPACSTTGCVECTSATDCATPYCANSRCVECVGDGDCGALRCSPAGLCTSGCPFNETCPASAPYCISNLCAQCFTNGQCAADEGCYDGACRAAIAGDTCGNALDVDMSLGSVIIAGDLGAYSAEDSNDVSADVYYRVHVAREGMLNGDITATGFFPLIEFEVLWGTCDSLALLGASGEHPGAASLREVFVTPGTYFVRVKTPPGFARAFTLHLFLTDGARAPGNSCLKPIVVDLDSNGQAVLTGTTAGMLPAAPDGCDGVTLPAQPDLVYAIDISTKSHLYAIATPLDPAFDLDLHLRGFCFNESSGLCSGPPEPGVARTVNTGPLAPGRYHLVVDSESQTTGPFELAIEVTPWALNDQCAAAAALVFTGGGVATVSAKLEPTGEEQCSCFSMSCNHQLAYSLSTVGMGDRAVTVDVASITPGFVAGVSLATTCGGLESAVIACDAYGDANRTARLEIPFLPEGNYFVQVGAGFYVPHPASLTLTATLSAAISPPANDSCASPQSLDLSSGSAGASGDTRGAADNQATYCGAVHLGPGRDVVYAVALPGRGRLGVTVTGQAGFDPYVKIDEGCPGPTTSTFPITCQNTSGPGQVESFTIGISRTLVYLWVDGVAGSEGTFDLATTFTLAAANDVCAGALDIPVGTSAGGNSIAAFNDTTTTACGAVGRLGPDLFYVFTPAQNGSRTVTVTPTGFDTRLDILADCSGVAACLGTSDVGGVGAVESVTFAATRNISYIIVVASPDVGGPFTVQVN